MASHLPLPSSFFWAAVFASAALYTRQPIIIAYVALTTITLIIILFVLKPIIYRLPLWGVSESPKSAWNLGFRLGHKCSEFSLLIGVLVLTINTGILMSSEANTLIQATTILILLAPSYIVVLNSPTPIAIKAELRHN